MQYNLISALVLRPSHGIVLTPGVKRKSVVGVFDGRNGANASNGALETMCSQFVRKHVVIGFGNTCSQAQ